MDTSINARAYLVVFLSTLVLFFPCLAQSQASDLSENKNSIASLEILYEERSPYVVKLTNTLKGLVATPLVNALDKQAISYRLVEKHSKRHLHEIRANNKPVCALGWFKNKERLSYGKYSEALYHDKPMVILVRKDNQKVQQGQQKLDDLVADKSLTVLARAGYSYGPFIDDKLNQFKTRVRRVSANNSTMLTLIAKKRADYMFISQEEANMLFLAHPSKALLRTLIIPDVPKGNARYLICSKQVEQSILDKINSSLR